MNRPSETMPSTTDPGSRPALHRWLANVAFAVVIAAVVSLALPTDPASADDGAADHRRVAKLLPQKRAVTPGDGFGVRVRNQTSATIEFGLGFGFERRRGGRWIDADEVFCPNLDCAVPDVGLLADPGQTVGAKYGKGLEDRVRVPASAPTGRYRITKRVRPGRREVIAKTVIRISDGRLLPHRRHVKPGSGVRFRVRNTGSLRMGFGLGIFGGSIERLDEGEWTDAQSEVCPGSSCAVGAVELTADPGEIAGPRYSDNLDVVRFRKTAEPGLYRVTKRVRYDGRRAKGSISAEVEVRP